MTRRIVLAALLALGLAAATQAADLPPGKWWRRPEVINQLNLSEEQQSKLESIWASSANDLIDLRATVEKENVGLRTLLDAATLDRAAIRHAATRLSEARGRLFDRELMMLVDMRNALNDQQWTRMRALLDRLNANQQQGQQRPNMQRRRQ